MFILSDKEIQEIKNYYFSEIPVHPSAQKERYWLIKLIGEIEIRRGLIEGELETEGIDNE